MSSPAQRYAAFKQRQQEPQDQLWRFRDDLEFPLDPFQISACEALEAGKDVLVAAPTGAGKTMIGFFAAQLALSQSRKLFYTTPIKALSNQKYLELCERFGSQRVGLLTGDTAINSDAEVVVMTTEVLRNMLYNDSTTVANLGFVVMDEVHYLADRFRGPVWEEVILHLAAGVTLVSLSATVSNAEEFGAWLGEVRGETEIIVSEKRPVPLWQHVMVRRDILDLYQPGSDPTSPGSSAALNKDLLAAIRRAGQRESSGRTSARGRRARRQARPRSMVRVHRPSRSATVAELDRDGLLPAIYFIFSRAGCQAAVEQVLRSGIALTTAAEAAEIEAIVDRRCAVLAKSDLAVLGYLGWLDALKRGVAAHHAGLLPLFKQVVEELFTRGLVKVVFATETLALGINMPARSVVLERLVKWDGTAHAHITPGEYTQLTGRAGRRGIDVEGHAVVLYDSDVDPEAVAGLASKRTYPLKSSFHPTYNMAVNLIDTTGFDRARETLETSFAQYQADRSVVSLARRVRTMNEAAAGYREAMTCHLGDFAQYESLRQQISAREKELSKSRSREARQALKDLGRKLKRGDVIAIARPKNTHYVVVTDQPQVAGMADTIFHAVSLEARAKRYIASDLPFGSMIVDHMQLPKRLDTRHIRDRKDLSARLRSHLASEASRERARFEKGQAAHRSDDNRGAGQDKLLQELRQEFRSHPCHGCPDRENHARWAHRLVALERERSGLAGRIEARTSSIARDFDRICAVLAQLGYLKQEGRDFTVEEAGQWLRRLYSEQDLLMAQCLREGIWDRLTPAQLAAVMAGVIYEARSSSPDAVSVLPGGQDGPIAAALRATRRLAGQITEIETAHKVTRERDSHWGLVAPMFAWASEKPLSRVLEAGDVTAGDFVRWARQVIDLLDQLAKAAPSAKLRSTARVARSAVKRGVVASDLADQV